MHLPENLTVAQLRQGVDFNLGRVLLLEDGVQLGKDVGSVLLGVLFESKLLGELQSLRRADTVVKVQGSGDDGIGSLLGNVLNVHTTLAGGDEHGTTGGSVVEDSRVVLFLRGHSLGEHDGVTDSAGGTGLLGDEFVAKHLFGVLLGLSGTVKIARIPSAQTKDYKACSWKYQENIRVNHLHTTLETRVKVTLSSATSQHLSLDHELVLAYSRQLSANRSRRLLQRCTRQCWPAGYLHVREDLPKLLATLSASAAEKAGRALGVGIPYCCCGQPRLVKK